MILVFAIAFLCAIAILGFLAAVEAREVTLRMEQMRRLESIEFDDWLAEQRKLISHERLKASKRTGGNNAA